MPRRGCRPKDGAADALGDLGGRCYTPPMTAPLNLASIDLNLMVIFDALMKDRHLSRAGDRVGLSQPAMSHALRRLRAVLGDDLFTRRRGVMEPTPRALALADPIGGALDRLRSALDTEPAFEPSTASRCFTLTMSDASAARLLPQLIPRLRAQGSGIDIDMLASGAREGIEHLLSGAADLGVGVFPNLPERLHCEVIQTARLVCIADAAHPALREGLTLQSFLALPHVGVDVGHDTGANVDSLIETMGLRRRIMLRVPHFMVVASVVIGSDLLAVVPAAVLREEEKSHLAVYELPVAVPDVAIHMAWRARQSQDPALVWLRRLVARSMRIPGPEDAGAEAMG